jgi:hypothetical protein
VDVWWEEEFDAVILANGHYSVPFIPEVKGLKAYSEKYPDRVQHSKYYRSPIQYKAQKLLVIGNSASGHDVAAEVVSTAQLPVYNSIRSKSRWDGDKSPQGIAWKPIIREFHLDGRIEFEDGTYLDDIDKVIYCTGYKASYPFWNEKVNGRALYDYEGNKIIKTYWHTFFQDFQTLAIVGLPRVLTFRSFEYQAIALARLYSGRNKVPLPPLSEQQKWESERKEKREKEHKKFHDIEWETGETKEWLGRFFEIAGLGTLTGDGRVPPVLGKDLVWAIEHLRKYPEPGKDYTVERAGEEFRACNASPSVPKTESSFAMEQLEKDPETGGEKPTQKAEEEVKTVEYWTIYPMSGEVVLTDHIDAQLKAREISEEDSSEWEVVERVRA